MSDLVNDLDTPTERLTIDVIPVDRAEQMLDEIRKRRLEPLRIYEELQARKKEARDEKTMTKVGRVSLKMKKKLDAAEKAVQEAEAMVREIKGLFIEMGI